MQESAIADYTPFLSNYIFLSSNSCCKQAYNDEHPVPVIGGVSERERLLLSKTAKVRRLRGAIRAHRCAENPPHKVNPPPL